MTETQLMKGIALKAEWQYLEKELEDISKILAEKGQIQVKRGESGYVYFNPASEKNSCDVMEELTYGLSIARDQIDMRIAHLKNQFKNIKT